MPYIRAGLVTVVWVPIEYKTIMKKNIPGDIDYIIQEVVCMLIYMCFLCVYLRVRACVCAFACLSGRTPNAESDYLRTRDDRQ